MYVIFKFSDLTLFCVTLTTSRKSVDLWPHAGKVASLVIWCNLRSVGADRQDLQQPVAVEFQTFAGDFAADRGHIDGLEQGYPITTHLI